MEKIYTEMIAFMVSSGKRIATKAGKIKDIGVKKQWLTEEDIAIERGMKEIIQKHHPNHAFFAEEEHDSFPENENVFGVLCSAHNHVHALLVVLANENFLVHHLQIGSKVEHFDDLRGSLQ